MLMVNNERARAGGFLNTLLFRYQNDKNPCDPKNEPPPFLASVMNFGVLAYLLWRYGRKPLSDALVKRREAIMGEIDNATRLKEDAEARLEEYEEKFENIHEKLEELRAEFAALAEAEKKHILEEAEERRARMLRDAEFRIDQELKQARVDLLREAVEGAVGAAEQLLKARIGQPDHDKMADDYLATVAPSLLKSDKPKTLGTGAPS
jgi:F-type H+-transporting ATPase subunit b